MAPVAAVVSMENRPGKEADCLEVVQHLFDRENSKRVTETQERQEGSTAV